ncbi:F-box/FBD/LRR-repeat protein At1g13570-like [Solanum stenotomum]|uniref:F-box/FBD/LRR-repeat protein At1g13570-like n=1 Tax=Solanum stenotomum TaxID=172797 RepID=UPI0020D1203B|nr:F-box/FBD/LRR-repeat protein At1g13570-like [Solanum stenotomum]
MPPEDNKHSSGTLPPDVLSNLHEKIIDHILVCLPLRDAVRTSILSKKWRCNRCRLPALTLDQALWDTTNNLTPDLVTRFTYIILELTLFNAVEPSPEAGQHDLTKCFEFCSALEHLHLDCGSLPVLAVGSGDIAAKLSSPLNCLKCLCLSNICLDELVELSPALCLIRSSPYLQDIQIKLCRNDVVNEIPSSFSDVTLNHLRSVKFEVITGKKTEMELVKLLLAKSPMLVRMLIQPDRVNGSAETRLKVVTELTKFPRASPKAEVYYNSGV